MMDEPADKKWFSKYGSPNAKKNTGPKSLLGKSHGTGRVTPKTAALSKARGEKIAKRRLADSDHQFEQRSDR